MNATAATLTLTLTETPSRSKAAGPCWAGVRRTGADRYTFATTAGAEFTALPGDTLTLAAATKVRHATRTGSYRDDITVIVTGDPADTVTIRVGSAQYTAATLTGARVSENA